MITRTRTRTRHFLVPIALTLAIPLMTTACTAAVPDVIGDTPVLEHIHQLVFTDPDQLLIGSHGGVYSTDLKSGTTTLVGDVAFDAMGLTAQGERVFASGHPGPSSPEAFVGPHIGIVQHSSTTGWESVALAGTTDFHILQSTAADANLLVGVGSDSPVLLRSTDAGRTWTNASPLNARDLSIDSEDPALLVATTQDGLLVSHDTGDTFAPLTGAPVLVLVANDPTRTAGLVGVDQQGKLWIGSAEPDASWTVAGALTGAAAAITVSGDGIIAVADDSGVAISADGGKTWRVILSAS
jgi:hypothetical protein